MKKILFLICFLMAGAAYASTFGGGGSIDASQDIVWTGHHTFTKALAVDTTAQSQIMFESTGSVKNVELIRISTGTTPSGTADSSGTQYDFKIDGSYLYFKSADGWKRSALTTW